jgi:hypothetical protein
MKYLLLIYRNEAEGKADGEGTAKMHQEYGVFTQAIIKTGQFKGGDALEPVANATTVRVRSGKTMTTDGPFAETREQLGGYYMVDCKDLDEAIGLAARIPSARVGSIEVRPIRVIE